MSGGFNEREAAFEAKFKNDEEMQFKRTVRAVKIFGLWAAGQLGISGGDAEAYAKAVVEADFAEPGLNDVIKKVKGDFASKKVTVSDHQIKTQLDLAMKQAAAEMISGKA